MGLVQAEYSATTAMQDAALQRLSELGALELDSEQVTIIPHQDGRFEVSKDGVYFVTKQASKRVCSELRVVAQTRDRHNSNWGRLLSWKDADGKKHEWAMPMDALQGDGTEVLKELASGGLVIASGSSRLLRDYLHAVDVKQRAQCVTQLGWHGQTYCTASETFGDAQGERIVFQSPDSLRVEQSQRGSLENWRNSVAALSEGNSRLIFALSCAFAGPLMQLIGAESGGFHLVGPSSCGKTTALRVAASVWGNPDEYVRQWRATANGLEGIAALHNDGILLLDELSQCDGRQAGEAAYMLANGKGKARASRLGTARAAATWRLLFLSSGEVPLAALMEGAGKKANAGQELRLANIQADAGRGLGIFDTLGACRDSAELAGAVRDACAASYGTAGRALLKRAVEDLPDLEEVLAGGVRTFVKEAIRRGVSGQVERVAQRFGLVAAAGELAAAYGITGWDTDEANAGVLACFKAWLEHFGEGPHETRAMVEQVRHFIEIHGSSRFQKLDAEEKVVNRAGFWREGANGAREYLVPSVTFKKEVAQGWDHKQAARALQEAGMLPHAKDSRLQISVRPSGSDRQWMYAIVLPEEEIACS